MSDRASGRSGHSRMATRAALLLAIVGLVAGPAAPIAAAAGGLTVTTPFPSVVARPGSTAIFKLTLTSNQDGDVKLAASGAPSGWSATFAGGGLTVSGAYVTKGNPVDINLNVEIPADATDTSANIRVQATGPQGTTTLPLTIQVQQQVGGAVTLTSDYPELQGPSTSTFTFNLTLKNGGTEESTFAIATQAPDGWTVTAKPSGQSQATSAVVAAGGSTTITVTALPPSQTDAGTSTITVTATGGGTTASADLKVTVTGSYSLDVSTPNQVLSTSANAGSTTDFQLTITNTGTAALTDVQPSASAPTGWKVTFDQDTIATIAPNETATVTAAITPTGDAITGDYNVTMSAKAAEASGSVTIRVKVETPAFWWIAGILLIAVVFVGLWWVFRTYGRR
jgi:uncharacterized membrane protein